MASRRLYTEDSIRALKPGTQIVLGKDALATPAALDLAFAHGIRVSWEVDGQGPASASQASPSEADLWQRMLATEGEFVVQVHQGRPKVFRLTPDGPVLFQ